MKKYLFIILFFLVIKTGAQSSVLKIADSLYTTGNYITAINKYAELGTTKANLQIAKSYNAIGNYDKAILQYKAIITKNPKLELARFQLGKLLLKTKKNALALSEFTTLVKDNLNNPEYFYYLGRAKTAKNVVNLGDAIVAYKKAVAIDSTHLRSIYRIGKYYVVKKEPDSVYKYVNKGLKFYENDVSLINIKALALFNTDQFKESAFLFERLITLGEQKVYIYNRLAYCYFKLYELKKAIDNYRYVLELQALNPDPSTYTKMAEVFRKDRELDSAKVYVQKAIDETIVTLDKEYGMLAGIAREQNQLGTALKYYKLAAKEAPEKFMYSFQVCIIGETYYKDAKKSLKCYENIRNKVKKSKLASYFNVVVDKRISKLKSEIFTKGN